MAVLTGITTILYRESYNHLVMVIEWIVIGGLALINALFTYYFVKRAEDGLADTLEGINGQLKQGMEDFQEQLNPIIRANSNAMGAISHLSDSTKMDKALERRIGQDMMDQAIGDYGDILELVKAGFPRVAEYIEERPEAFTKLIPRINQLISDPEARKRLNLNPSPSSRTLQPHPFRDER